VPPLIEARAPGKLVIVGEYAVLHGAPGISVAVDVAARSRLQCCAGPHSELLIPDSGERFGFDWPAAGGVRWHGEHPGALGLPLESCLATLGARGLWPPSGGLPTCRIELDTAAFHHRNATGQRIKLGLGSSAAVLVTLMGALLQIARVASLTRDELIALCCAAHRHLQGGSGSGIDVATAVAGGVISIELSADDRKPRTTQLAWPGELHMLAIWSGNSASTPAMLARLEIFRTQRAGSCDGHMAELGAIAGQALSAWRRADVSRLLTLLESYASALHALDQDAGIGIYGGGHEAMRRIARAHGAVYKPSGAGGGDFGIALASSAQRLAAVAGDFSARGYTCLEAALCAPGLTVTRGAQPR
jgi:phosphomevalonate kinase